MDETMYLPLDEEEQEILDWIDREDWEPVPVTDSAEKIEQLRQSARAFLANQELPVLITRDELIEARQILITQLEHGSLMYEVTHPVGVTSNQIIKSLLDKIEAAIANCSLAS
jgi:hypothetical protein